ncbi:uncharacterized protein QC763_0107770 [Podospora pseudopauciseta]|uniref:Anticodon-binding domain-containing protein n=1 Tax=Podospora pseudopauciseta TaxID=2093780 RepID=A0ABR0H1J4_9PEZI|nr:hypothetical protein QC763_0107770 [Podospora pseudopauciseta]
MEENMLELDCTVITPELVLKTSGHVDKFADWMCKEGFNVLKARIERGTKGLTKNSAKLDGGTAAEYENILAQVSFFLWKSRFLRVSVALIGSAYDLTVHSAYTGSPLIVKEALSEPVKVEEWQATLDKKLIGPRFKKDAKPTLERLASEIAEKGIVSIDTPALGDGRTSVELSKELLTIAKVTRVQNTRVYTPNVIESSFGIGRILYCVLKQTYWHRPGDETRAVLSLPFGVAPNKLSARLRSLGISNIADSPSASIGKRYARNDELGTPLGITIDFDTMKDGSVTLRDRDSTCQVRASEDGVVQAIKNMVNGMETWEEVSKRLSAFVGQAE